MFSSSIGTVPPSLLAPQQLSYYYSTLSCAGTLLHLLQGSDDVSSSDVVVFCLISSLILWYVDLVGLLYKLPCVPRLSRCMQHTLSLVHGVGTADGRNVPCWKYRYKRQDVCSPFTVAQGYVAPFTAPSQLRLGLYLNNRKQPQATMIARSLMPCHTKANCHAATKYPDARKPLRACQP
jgi:hypothetical protein